MSIFSKLCTKSTLTSFLVLSTFLGACELAAGPLDNKRKREETGEKTTGDTTTVSSKKSKNAGTDNWDINDDEINNPNFNEMLQSILGQIDSETNIHDLPEEMLLSIFSHLKLADLAAVKKTCKAWNNLAQDSQLFNHLALKDTPRFTYHNTLHNMDYSWWDVIPLGNHTEFLFKKDCESHKWDLKTKKITLNHWEKTSGSAERLKFSDLVKSDNTTAFVRTTFQTSKGTTKLEDIIQRKPRKTRELRELLLTTPNTKKPHDILPGLISALYSSIKTNVSIENFTELCYSRTLPGLQIQGLSPDASLVFGGLTREPDNSAREYYTFAYNHSLKNIFVSQEFLNLPEFDSVSSDGLTLIGRILPRYPHHPLSSHPHRCDEFLLRWSLQKDADGSLASENCDVLPANNGGRSKTIKAASPDMRIVSIRNNDTSPADKTEGTLWRDNNHVYSLQEIMTHRPNENINAFFQAGGVLLQAQHVGAHKNKLIFVGTGYFPRTSLGQKRNLIWHASFNTLSFEQTIQELNEKAENK